MLEWLMETMLVIIGLMLIGSVVLTNAASIFYFATQGFVVFISAWAESSGLCAIKLPLKIRTSPLPRKRRAQSSAFASLPKPAETPQNQGATPYLHLLGKFPKLG